MTGQAHWLALILIALGLLAIALLLWEARRAERKFYVEDRRFFCPKFRREVIATLVTSGPEGKILGVCRCTGLPEPDMVTCGKECVAALNRRAAGTGSSS